MISSHPYGLGHPLVNGWRACQPYVLIFRCCLLRIQCLTVTDSLQYVGGGFTNLVAHHLMSLYAFYTSRSQIPSNMVMGMLAFLWANILRCCVQFTSALLLEASPWCSITLCWLLPYRFQNNTPKNLLSLRRKYHWTHLSVHQAASQTRLFS